MALGIKNKIIQIAGYSNSGKTTLVEKLVSYCSNDGLLVGTLKHHGHGRTLKSLDKGKDSWKHRNAGAMVTGVASNHQFQLHLATLPTDWSLEKMLEFYDKLPLDLILIEGFKREPFPKVVIVRTEEGLELLEQLTNIIAVITWIRLEEIKEKMKVPVFSIEEEQEYLNWIKEQVNKEDE
ncbi:molybdopterin-guanine dinucleotide biosynthesis protein B [Anaerobacillus sp. MEB173]|uniref:molybdopterin-guanine dinucleotide biosynthesis protein B n=1 Tax=Anaerobacillus sp. MEB173 TaxID=3383345 RepID=UPI003F903281